MRAKIPTDTAICPSCDMSIDWQHEDPDDYDDYDDYDGCPECGDGTEPDSWQSACWDDLCHGGEVPCMHGDYARLPCSLCGK